MISQLTTAVALAIVSIVTITATRGDELLVLRNGFAIQGRVSRIGDRYVVTIASGSETRIPISAVELRCRDFEDAYQQKANGIGWDRTSKRVELIDWCLRHELFEQANEQILILQRADPHSAALPQLRRRLELLSTSTASRPSVPSTPVRLKSDELDLLMRDLPEESVEQFTTTVQPLLLNRCSTGGCHGSRTGNAFRLIRPRFGRELERPFTQRNLHAVLKSIDNQNPSSSSFAEALHVHGPDKSADPMLTKSQIEQVQWWMKQLTKTRSTNRKVTIPAPPTLLQASTSSTSKWESGGSSRIVTAVSGVKQERPAPKQSQNESNATADPFDPEVFNRRYHARTAERVDPASQTGPLPPREFSQLPNSQTPNRRR